MKSLTFVAAIAVSALVGTSTVHAQSEFEVATAVASFGVGVVTGVAVEQLIAGGVSQAYPQLTSRPQYVVDHHARPDDWRTRRRQEYEANEKGEWAHSRYERRGYEHRSGYPIGSHERDQRVRYEPREEVVTTPRQSARVERERRDIDGASAIRQPSNLRAAPNNTHSRPEPGAQRAVSRQGALPPVDAQSAHRPR